MAKQIGEFHIIQYNIARGAFAYIHKGKHIYTHKIVAIKEIKVDNVNYLKEHVKRELDIHRQLNNDNIVKIYDIIIDNNENSIYMIMEYCEYGDLQKFQNKKPFQEKYIQCYMFQLRDALKYLYDNKIIHRDLKPQNILLTDPLKIKITDFGLARTINNIPNIPDIPKNNIYFEDVMEQDLFSTYCGSPIYMSPELLNKKNYNTKSDLWSVGVILYELITGYPPFIAKNIKQLINKVNTENINLDIIDKKLISNECFNLLCGLLTQDKNARLNWNGFFNHIWFKNNLLLEYENKLIENPFPELQKLLTPPPQEHIQLEQQLNDNNNTNEDKLKFSDSLKISDYKNITLQQLPLPTQQLQYRNSIKSQFTFNLKSSSLSISHSLSHSLSHSQPTTQLIDTNTNTNTNTNININNISPLSQNQNINLSDLEQDDIKDDSNNYILSSKSSKPIPIKQNKYNQHNNNKFNFKYNNYNSDNTDSSGSNNSLSITPKSLENNKILYNKVKKPNGKIANALLFFKETYDYLSNDTKSI